MYERTNRRTLLSMSGVQWGTVGQWLGSVGTTCAFLATFYVIRRDAKIRRRTQAAKVAFYHVTPDGRTILREGEEASFSTDWPEYVLLNLSDEPIYGIQLTNSSPDGRVIERDTYPLLLPGEDIRNRRGWSRNNIPTRAAFTDNSGRRWYKYPDGRLAEATPRRRSLDRVGEWRLRRKRSRMIRKTRR